jgi:hypothetical protein
MDLMNPPDACRLLDDMMARVGYENGFHLLVSVNWMRVDEVLVLDTLFRSRSRWFGGLRAKCLRCRTFAAGALERARNSDEEGFKGRCRSGGGMIFGRSRCR